MLRTSTALPAPASDAQPPATAVGLTAQLTSEPSPAASESASPAMSAPSALTTAPALRAAASTRGFASFLDNRTPTANPTPIGQNGNIVTGVLNATDADDDQMTYSVIEGPQH